MGKETTEDTIGSHTQRYVARLGGEVVWRLLWVIPYISACNSLRGGLDSATLLQDCSSQFMVIGSIIDKLLRRL